MSFCSKVSLVFLVLHRWTTLIVAGCPRKCKSVLRTLSLLALLLLLLHSRRFFPFDPLSFLLTFPSLSLLAFNFFSCGKAFKAICLIPLLRAPEVSHHRVPHLVVLCTFSVEPHREQTFIHRPLVE